MCVGIIIILYIRIGTPSMSKSWPFFFFSNFSSFHSSPVIFPYAVVNAPYSSSSYGREKRKPYTSARGLPNRKSSTSFLSCQEAGSEKKVQLATLRKNIAKISGLRIRNVKFSSVERAHF